LSLSAIIYEVIDKDPISKPSLNIVTLSFYYCNARQYNKGI